MIKALHFISWLVEHAHCLVPVARVSLESMSTLDVYCLNEVRGLIDLVMISLVVSHLSLIVICVLLEDPISLTLVVRHL